jgi:hypothetical protein
MDVDAIARASMLDWLAARINADLKAAPSVLWHYTTAVGLGGIVSSDRLWATSARFLNDSQEISYGIDRAVRALAMYDLTGRQPATQRFVRGLADPAKNVLRGFLDISLDAFVTCFCSDGDLLSQWRAYAGAETAGGYALGFCPPGPLPAWPQAAPDGHALTLRRVSYDPAEQDASLDDLITRMVDLLDVDPADIPRQNAFARNLVDGLVEAVTSSKHPAFEEEREWRIVYVRSTDQNKLDLCHRPAGGLLVPYVALELPRGVGADPNHLPLAHINCGPSPEPAHKQHGVKSLLTTKPHLAGVDVEGSLAPLRL